MKRVYIAAALTCLAVMAAFAACRGGWPGSAAGVLLLTLSLGIYQAYLPAAAVLMAGSLLLETLDEDAD